ncbi:hypothetical protein [Butyrivibrio fibrisolvens]|uniref:hypothetical protein n=1 Tax=Butyrivibrio fibrisolvens TaxID=831 RepID=UPI0012BC4887|nr:hypothetical protein [Butyrivibrio fibrisolvens]
MGSKQGSFLGLSLKVENCSRLVFIMLLRCRLPCGVRSIDVKEKYIKPIRVFELEDGVGIYRKRRR